MPNSVSAVPAQAESAALHWAVRALPPRSGKQGEQGACKGVLGSPSLNPSCKSGKSLMDVCGARIALLSPNPGR